MSGHDHEPVLGLIDGCPACRSLAADPMLLDSDALLWIWKVDWFRLSELDRLAREKLSRAVSVTALLSRAFEYADYEPLNGGPIHQKMNYTDLYQKRGAE